MSYTEVRRLIDEGRLEQAISVARNDIQLEKNEWSCLGLFDVMKECCINELNNGQTERAEKFISQMEVVAQEVADPQKAKRTIESLRFRLIPHAKEVADALRDARQGDAYNSYEFVKDLNSSEPLDERLHETYGQLIYYYLREGLRTMGTEKAQEVLDEYIKLKNPRPSTIHSSIANMASHICAEYPDVKLMPFVKAWDVCNLTEDDLKPVQLTDRVIAPLSQRLVDRCLSLGYSISEVTEEFTRNPNIKAEDIIDRVCRRGYSSIYEMSKRDPHSTLDVAMKYANQIAGKKINNQYHSKALATTLYALSRDQVMYFAEFMEKWGFGNLREEDWQKQGVKPQRGQRNVKETPSLGQKALNAYADSIKAAGIEPSEDFDKWIDEAIAHDPSNDANYRMKARLQMSLGNVDAALSTYGKLIINNSRPYIWAELAMIAPNAELKKAALCKAILNEQHEERTTETHLELAKVLVAAGKREEAERELLTYYNICTNFQMMINPDYDDLQASLGDVTPTASNKAFYVENSAAADAFLLRETTEVKMKVVEVTEKSGKTGNSFVSVTLLSANGLRILCNVEKLNATYADEVRGKSFKINYATVGDHCKVLAAEVTEEEVDLSSMISVGYIDGMDKGKNTYHVYSVDSTHFVSDAPSVDVRIGDFIEFYPVIPKDSNFNKAIIIRQIDYKEGAQKFGLHKAVVARVDYNKRHFNCVSEGGYAGMVGYDNGSIPQPGEMLIVAYIVKTDKNGNKSTKYISIDLAEEGTESEDLKKDVTGPIHLLRNEKGFEYGFVNFEEQGYYVSGYLLKNKKISEGDVITASVVNNGDNWFAFAIEKKA